VPPTDVPRALSILAAMNAPLEPAPPDTAHAGWITVRVPADRSVEVNRLLAQNGIYASALDVSSDLESVFLALTMGAPAAAGPAAGPLPGWGTPPPGTNP
jgi:hypothetical protein